MSRRLCVTLTGFFAIAATTAALAQPTPKPVPEPVPVPDVEIYHYVKPDIDFEGLKKIDIEGMKDLKMKLEGLKDVKYEIDGLKAYKWEMDGLKDKLDVDAKRFKYERKMFDGKPFDGKVFVYDTKNQGELARMFERCDAQRGGDAEEQEDRNYDCGRRAIDESQWDRAVDYFTRAAAVKGTRADGALYWKAYSQNRLGQRTEALSTLAELKNGYAKSRWTNDASALEVEVRQRSGQKVDPANTSDDELKLLALNALGDSPEAVPMLERLLTGPQSPKLK